MKPCHLLCLCMAVGLLAACHDKPRTVRKDRSAGGTTEILVVTQNMEQWNGMIGDSLKRYPLDYK